MPEDGCLTGCGRSGGACCPEGRSAADSKPPGDCICLMWAAAYRANGDSTDCFRAILADAALQGGDEEGIQPLLPQVRPCIKHAQLHPAGCPVPGTVQLLHFSSASIDKAVQAALHCAWVQQLPAAEGAYPTQRGLLQAKA